MWIWPPQSRDPSIHVITLMSYFDFASPYLKTEYDLAHMPFGHSSAGNLSNGIPVAAIL
jgi:hypothetical protein